MMRLKSSDHDYEDTAALYVGPSEADECHGRLPAASVFGAARLPDPITTHGPNLGLTWRFAAWLYDRLSGQDAVSMPDLRLGGHSWRVAASSQPAKA